MKSDELLLIARELSQAAEQVDGAQLDALAQEIRAARRVFVAGAGRSGFAARGFVNRLMHLGFDVHFVGDPATPPIGAGDLLVIGSGSGKTAGLVVMAEKAASLGARLATVTLAPENPIGRLCQVKVTLPGTTRLLEKEAGDVRSARANTGDSCASGFCRLPQNLTAQPMGSLFEQLSWLVYDALTLRLMTLTHQTPEDLVRRHGNLE